MVWNICFEPSQTFALQVSELSERQSVGSFEISSSSEDDLEEDEQDQEYTIYSVLPNRQLEVVSKLPAKSKTSCYPPPGPRGLEDANVRSKGPPGRTQSQTGGKVAITSAPQSCTVHEGKILTLTCIVAGPKYTGIKGNICFSFKILSRRLLVPRLDQTLPLRPPLVVQTRHLAPPRHLRHRLQRRRGVQCVRLQQQGGGVEQVLGDREGHQESRAPSRDGEASSNWFCKLMLMFVKR